MIKWDESFSVGIPLIDAQHQKLFGIAGEIVLKLERFDENNTDQFSDIINFMDQLLDYTKYHFSQEEKLMAHYGYPNSETHNKEHLDFIKYLNDVDYIKVNNKPKQTISELTQFITKWIFNHVLQSDFMYKDFILKAMAKETDVNRN